MLSKKEVMSLGDILEFAASGQINRLIPLMGRFDINLPDEGGRTLLHHAALGSQKDCYNFLLRHGAREDIEDNMGFKPYESMLNPPPFYLTSPCEDLDQYRQYILSEKRTQLPEGTALIYIKRVEEINLFIEKNPELNRIGFILFRPNVLRELKIEGPGEEVSYKLDDHVAPIYFQRNKGVEYFIQLDSLFNNLYLLPASTNKDQKRFFIYSFLPRQTAPSGCFEDAVLVLLKLIKISDNSFLQFCTKAENREQLSYKVVSLEKLEQEKEKFTDEFKLTKAISLQALYYEKIKMPYTLSIFRLKRFPEYLVPHIEHYATMREHRVRQPGQFLKIMNPSHLDSPTYLDYILKLGCLREPDTTDIRENLQNESRKFDFKGKNFRLREKEFVHYRLAMQDCIYTLFKTHMVRVHKVTDNKIAKKITDYATGDKRYDTDAPLSIHL